MAEFSLFAVSLKGNFKKNSSSGGRQYNIDVSPEVPLLLSVMSAELTLAFKGPDNSKRFMY